jgi:hypothetical protein
MYHLLATLIQTVSSNPTPFEWASQHLHLIGWPVLVVLSWKVGTFFTQTKAKVEKTVEQINTMATNHFPHMEKSLINMDKNITRLVMHQTGDASVVEN